ncbi:hypothetical protein Gain_0077_077 [Komagataeibacter intermedius TF2]|uniref:Uncharacterized protein n=1 Tax=Komagataeibacter intermedius NRIC 0521 TaxID=1307934 RepID=A0ABQ0PQ71_9PROT|nr:hypothetical protein Gain_0077_077 [Komagataeibacter intermedius TF2]GBQ78023.1 hypothetical protein AA0521_3097 [Komagataeibacter intermedius NRIC 0521]
MDSCKTRQQTCQTTHPVTVNAVSPTHQNGSDMGGCRSPEPPTRPVPDNPSADVLPGFHRSGFPSGRRGEHGQGALERGHP